MCQPAIHCLAYVFIFKIITTYILCLFNNGSETSSPLQLLFSRDSLLACFRERGMLNLTSSVTGEADLESVQLELEADSENVRKRRVRVRVSCLSFLLKLMLLRLIL